MAHTYINGQGGSVTFNAQSLDVATWELTVTGEALDTTNTGDGGWESNIAGIKAWEGTVETFWDSAAVPTGAAGFIPNTSATITMLAGTTGKSYTGTARITSITINNPAKGAPDGFKYAFKGTGSLTYAS